MYLHNQTAMQFVLTDSNLITRVKYQLDGDMKIIPNETYRQDLNEEIKLENQTSLKIHGITEDMIRAILIEYNKIQYKATNPQTFLNFLKGQWGLNKQPPQTTAHFTLPILTINDCIRTNLKHCIQLKTLPWQVKSKSEFREAVIDPEFHQLELNHTKQTLSAILAYPFKAVSSLTIEGCIS